ncbi:hypothetical protein NC651_007950 [Populus alba x Populus x berolinensis]|nr:hypothetical protein NC651_007950 [Populus alba x Populus x berolinensis]
MLQTQEDVDNDGMERCKGLCKYTFRQESGVVFTALRLCFARFFSRGGCSRAFFSAAEAPWRLFIDFCLVHVQIEAVWLVLSARGDVSRRVINCIGWDGFIEVVLLVCGGPSH